MEGDAARGIRGLRFFNGFALSLPARVSVARSSGPDYWIYRFTSKDADSPFLHAYVGHAANFPYFAPREGTEITESLAGEKLTCGVLLIRETRRGDVTEVGGSVTRDGKRCGEILVRATATNGTISSPAIHFWYSNITEEQEQIVTMIIDSVVLGERMADDPPLDSGAVDPR